MSYEAALKRAGLLHLKDKPEEVLKAANQIIAKYEPQKSIQPKKSPPSYRVARARG